MTDPVLPVTGSALESDSSNTNGEEEVLFQRIQQLNSILELLSMMAFRELPEVSKLIVSQTLLEPKYEMALRELEQRKKLPTLVSRLLSLKGFLEVSTNMSGRP